MCPTSIAVWNCSRPPSTGQTSPSRAWRRSANRGSVVAPGLDAAEVPAVAVCARDELPFAKRLVGDDLDVDADRAERAASRAERGADLVVGRRTHGGVEGARGLALVEPVVAADEREHERAVGLHDRHRLRRRCGVDLEQLGERLDRLHARRLDLLRRVEARRELGCARDAARLLDVGGVVAVLAAHERVLTRLRRREEVTRDVAAHLAALRLHLVHLEAAALEDPVVRLRVELEVPVEPLLVAVERVRVLHDELADADEPAARPGLVAVLRLEVVQHLRQLPVRLDLGRMERERLLVAHRQDERTSARVLQPEEDRYRVAA